MPPFFTWYLKIIKNLNWNNLFILSTIQKLIPLILILELINLNNNLIKLNIINLIIFSFIFSLIGLQNINLKIILTFSSIIQISWIIIVIFINEKIFISYIIIYSIINLCLIQLFKKLNIIYLNDLNLIKFKLNWIFIIIIIFIFSLARIPPFIGFLIKWISIQIMFNNVSFFIIIIIILNSLIRIFFYIRIIFIILIINYNSIKINYIYVNFNYKFNQFWIFINWLIIPLILIYEII